MAGSMAGVMALLIGIVNVVLLLVWWIRYKSLMLMTVQLQRCFIVGLILTSKIIIQNCMKGIRSTRSTSLFVIRHFCPPSADLHKVMK